MPTATFARLAADLIEQYELEPAPWVAATLSSRATSFAASGIRVSRELQSLGGEWSKPAFRRRVAALLSRSGGFYWCPVALGAPPSILFTGTPSEVVAYLGSVALIAEDPDSGAVLGAAWSSKEAASPVVSFLFDDVAASDPKPGDWVLEAPSIREALRLGGEPEARPRLSRVPQGKELARLYRRAIWIAYAIHGTKEVDASDLDDCARTVHDASPLSVYRRERERLGAEPHLAAYWLLSHALLGQRDALADALVRSRPCTAPVVRELARVLAPAAEGKPVVEKLLAKRRPEWGPEALATIRAEAGSAAR